MSEFYTRFAFVVPMTIEQAQEATAILTALIATGKRPAEPAFGELYDEILGLHDGDSPALFDLTIRPAAGGLLIASGHDGSTNDAAAIAQALLNHYDLPDPVGFEVVEYAHRMTVNGYSGLAILVTKTSITDKSTSECLQELRGAAEKAPR